MGLPTRYYENSLPPAQRAAYRKRKDRETTFMFIFVFTAVPALMVASILVSR